MAAVNSKTVQGLLAVAMLASPAILFADESEQNRDPELIELSDLPTPPETLGDLIKQGSVKFFVGQRPASSTQYGRPSGERGGVMAAETHFQLSFDYRSRTRWRLSEADGKTKLVITASFPKISLKTKHDVWFQNRPASSDFWENLLVLHEFDHIRLSSDPRVEKQFAQRLRENTVITEEIASKASVNDAMIRRLVRAHASKIFDETVELVNIRYRELDRQTGHGLRPLPEDSSLSEWLR